MRSDLGSKETNEQFMRYYMFGTLSEMTLRCLWRGRSSQHFKHHSNTQRAADLRDFPIAFGQRASGQESRRGASLLSSLDHGHVVSKTSNKDKIPLLN